MSARVALVTGGIGGLGTAICRALAEAGRRVVAADLPSRPERLSAFREALAHLDGQVQFRPVDVADFEDCRRLIEEVSRDVGPIDILVNAAGITRDVTLRKMSPEQWSEVIRVNLEGVFNLTRHVVEGMCERGFGRIVNISSVNGQTGQFGQTNYAAAKAGMHGFTMALAREVARKGVTVNSVSPGYCRTQLVMSIPEPIRARIIESIPVGRLGEPEEVARAVVFLTEDSAGYITGANLPVNGGYYMSF
jgi:acetoacetyl-CoA reductase